MLTIDFLPERYRQATARRNSSYWRLAAAMLVLGVFAACAGWLYVVERDVRAEHQRLSLACAAVQSQKALVDRKQAELRELNRKAELVTFLRHPWAKSRILREATTPLPASVTIDAVRIQAVERPKPVGETSVIANEAAGASVKTIDTDLADLRAAVEASDTVVTVQGTTRDQPALHEYVASLSASPLFSQAELTSIEAQTEYAPQSTREQSAATLVEQAEAKFVIRIVVRPGLGITGGPTADDPLLIAPAPTAESREAS